MILKLATTPLCYTIIIWKLNNIIINRLQNPQPNVFPDKQQFDTSWDCKIFKNDFDSVNLDIIPDNILQALNFHFSSLGYLEEKVFWFVNITNNSDLTIELVDNSQPIINFKNEKVRKQNKCIAKKKAQLDNLFAPIQASAAGSAAFLLFCPKSLTCL